MDSGMQGYLNSELIDYYDWVKDNIKMIRMVLRDIAFGFDDYHLELIEERLQYILESESSYGHKREGSPATAIRITKNYLSHYFN